MTQVFHFQWLFPLISFLTTIAGLWFLLRSGLATRVAVDVPNHRSLHTLPMPRIGGLVTVPAFLLAWILSPEANPLQLGLVAILAVFSYMDDRAGLSAALRLGVHLAVAAAFTMLLLDLQDMAWVMATLLWIAWCTNLYNFMDGADGLAGGMALFGFSACGLAAAMSGHHDLAIASCSIASASAGFLLFNFPPAKTFMGDAGSIPLGFLMGALSVLGYRLGAWPLWFPILVFLPFVADATVTLLKRVVRGEQFWQAHHEHYYQRLVRMGWSHRKLALNGYGVMFAAAGSALLLLNFSESVQCIGLLVWVSLYALAMVAIDIRWKRHLFKASNA